MKATDLTFSRVEHTAPMIVPGLAWTGKTHCYSQSRHLISQMRRRHWLLAPDEIPKVAMLDWVSAHSPAEWGNSAQGDLIDSDPGSSGGLCGGGCAGSYLK